MRQTADRIRNVALVGHRGAGKTLAARGAAVRGGRRQPAGIGARREHRVGLRPRTSRRGRCRSRRRSARCDWHERKINLLDTPGEPSFVADALGALRVCESAVFVVNAVMGVEVSTARLWAARRRARHRADAVREHARPRARRLLPHAGAAQAGVRAPCRRDRDPDRLRARGRGRDRPRRHEGAYRHGSTESPIAPAGLE